MKRYHRRNQPALRSSRSTFSELQLRWMWCSGRRRTLPIRRFSLMSLSVKPSLSRSFRECNPWCSSMHRRCSCTKPVPLLARSRWGLLPRGHGSTPCPRPVLARRARQSTRTTHRSEPQHPVRLRCRDGKSGSAYRRPADAVRRTPSRSRIRASQLRGRAADSRG